MRGKSGSEDSLPGRVVDGRPQRSDASLRKDMGAAPDAEMAAAFAQAFGEFGAQFVDAGGEDAPAAWGGADDAAGAAGAAGDGAAPPSFASMLAASLDGEVQQRRRRRQAHVDRLLGGLSAAGEAKEEGEPLPAACTAAAPVALAVTPPRAAAMA